MKSHCDIWELSNRWGAQRSDSLIHAPTLTIHASVSYAKESGKMSYLWKTFSPLLCSLLQRTLISIICIDKSGSGMINNHLFKSLYMFASLNSCLIPSHIPVGRMRKGRKNKRKVPQWCIFCRSFQCTMERERDSNHSNEGLSLLGPSIVCPGSLFPGTLLEMSTAGNWIHLAVRVEPQLTDAQTGETLKWQMFPLLLKPGCKAVTSRYRLSDVVWGLWQSSGLLKTTSKGRWGGVTDALE